MVISFIVEAFVFKIQATQKRRECIRHPNADCNCKRGEVLDSEGQARARARAGR